MDSLNGDDMEMLETESVVEMNGLRDEVDDDEPFHLELPGSPLVEVNSYDQVELANEKIKKELITPVCKEEPVIAEDEDVKPDLDNISYELKVENIDNIPPDLGTNIKTEIDAHELSAEEICPNIDLTLPSAEGGDETITVPHSEDRTRENAAMSEEVRDEDIPLASRLGQEGQVNGTSCDDADDTLEVEAEEEVCGAEAEQAELAEAMEDYLHESQPEAIEDIPQGAKMVESNPTKTKENDDNPQATEDTPGGTKPVEDAPQENGHLSDHENDSEAQDDNESEVVDRTPELSTTKSRPVVRKKKKRKGKRVSTRSPKKTAKELSDTESPSEVKAERKNNVKKSVAVAKNSQKRVGDDVDSINVIKKKLKTCGKITPNFDVSNLNGKNLQAIIEILRTFSYHQLTFQALWELIRMSFCTVAANENPNGKLQRIMKKVLKVSREHNRLFALTREQFVTFTQIIQKVIDERELAKNLPGMVIAPPKTARTVGVQVQATILPPIPKPTVPTTIPDVIDLDDEVVDENSSVSSSSDTVTVEPARMETDTDSDSSQPSTAQKTPSSSIAPTLHARLSGNVTIHPVTPVQAKQQTPKPTKPIPTQIARKGTTYAHPLAAKISSTNVTNDSPEKNAAMFRVKKLAANGELTIKSSRQSTPSTPTQAVSPSPRRASTQEVIDLTDNENVNLTPTISADSVRTISKRMSAAMEASKSSSSVKPKTKLPALPVAPSKYPNGPTPPRPVLSVARSNTGVIVLSWNFPDGVSPQEEITFFQVYSYQESKDSTAGPGWNKVGHIKALELPMACKLHQLVTGHRYFFAVRAMDHCQRLGPFSSIESIQVTPLPNRTKT